MRPRIRVAIFLAFVTLLTALVQWPHAEVILDTVFFGGIPWSAELVVFLKQNTQGLVVFILLGIFLEWSGLRKSAEKDRREQSEAIELLTHSLAASRPQALIQEGLKLRYGSDAAIQLVQSFEENPSILRNLSLSVTVKRHGEEHFLVESQLTYRCDSQRFLVATSTSTACMEALLASGEIAEAFLTESLDVQVPATVQRIDEESGGHHKQVRTLELQEVSNRQKTKIFKRLKLQFPLTAFKLYEAKLPKGVKETDPQKSSYRITSCVRHHKSISYVYWMNDRVAQIDTIEVNLKDIGLDQYKDAKIHRFMASRHWPLEVNLESGHCILPLNTWSIAGDGVAIFWKNKIRNDSNMKVKDYISGGSDRCVQASYRMIVQALTDKDPGKEVADQITGFVEGRGTWQFRMLLGFASLGLNVKDHEDFSVENFLENPYKAIELQVGDAEAAKGVIAETDIEAETTALSKCKDNALVDFVESIPTFDDLKREIDDGKLVMINVNLRVLEDKPGREGHILIIEDIGANTAIVHDPGPNGGLGIEIPLTKLEDAWTSPSESMANYISVWRS